MWFNLFTVIFLVFFNSGKEQKATMQLVQKRILIVPFDRLGFQSTINLPTIRSSNQFNSVEEVSLNYQRQVVKSLSRQADRYLFIELPENEVKLLKRQAPIIHKMKPTSHYGIDLSRLRQEDLIKNMLSNFSADYILFLCRYTINNKVFSSSRSFDGSNFVKWSIHGMDYEVYNSEKELIALANEFDLVPERPTDNTYLTYGVRIDGMKDAYKDLRLDIEKKIDRYVDTPIYK